MRHPALAFAMFVLGALLALPASAPAQPLRGVNLAGAEFGNAIPGNVNIDYVWPTTQEIDHFASRGMNVVRVPFRWERMQPVLGGSLAAAHLASLDALVAHATSRGVTVVLDPHNYARYNGTVIGPGGAVTHAHFADFWSRLALHYAGAPQVVFALMNEPHGLPTEQWLDSANAAIAAIRAAGATQLVLVPGNGWTGAHSWHSDWYGTPNAQVMGNVVDPLGHYAFELHQYFDQDYSGTSPTCRSEAGTGTSQLQGVTAWLRERGLRGFLGEFAGADNDDCRIAVQNALAHMDANADVWLGWSWWAAGPWWGDYMFTLEPDGSGDRPQMPWLTPWLGTSPQALFANGFEP